MRRIVIAALALAASAALAVDVYLGGWGGAGSWTGSGSDRYWTAVSGGDPNVTNGLVAWWKFDDEAGSTFVDSSGNANSITSSISHAVTNGVRSGAIVLSGDALQAFALSGGPSLETNVAMSMWIRPNDGLANLYVLSRGAGGVDQAVTYRYTADSVGFYNGGWIVQFVAPVSNWTHVCISSTATNSAIYSNGVEVATSGTPFTSSSSSVWQLGGLGSGNRFAGWIDDLRVYNRTLTTNEIATISAP